MQPWLNAANCLTSKTWQSTISRRHWNCAHYFKTYPQWLASFIRAVLCSMYHPDVLRSSLVLRTCPLMPIFSMWPWTPNFVTENWWMLMKLVSSLIIYSRSLRTLVASIHHLLLLLLKELLWTESPLVSTMSPWRWPLSLCCSLPTSISSSGCHHMHNTGIVIHCW